jgi:hypothetical protein
MGFLMIEILFHRLTADSSVGRLLRAEETNKAALMFQNAPLERVLRAEIRLSMTPALSAPPPQGVALAAPPP